ncbi:MAG: NUDIX hydrolase [Sulfobacillus sp.]
MQKWAVVSREYVVDNTPYDKLRRDRCRLPSGEEINYYVNEYSDWVNALVVTPQRPVVLLQQYRHGVQSIIREIPGGMMEPLESPQDAIVREVREETGYASSEPPVFLGKFYPNPATSNNMVHCFLIDNAERVGHQQLDPTEDISIAEFSFDEMGLMIQSGTLPHLFSVATYYLAKNWLATHRRQGTGDFEDG